MASLASLKTDGAPHLVPITFAIQDRTVYTMVDWKPKTTTRLRRLANIQSDPRVTVLVDNYDSDWSQLWWVRIDGTATIARSGDGFDTAQRLLAAKYPPYRENPPSGPAIVIAVDNVNSWEWPR